MPIANHQPKNQASNQRFAWNQTQPYQSIPVNPPQPQRQPQPRPQQQQQHRQQALSSVYSASPALMAATASRHAPVCGVAGSSGALRVLNVGLQSSRTPTMPLGLTLNSLDFSKK
jgi:hypothetical protein